MLDYDIVDIIPDEPVLLGFCFGDNTMTSCPCGNVGSAGEGCANSSGVGARLSAGGWVSATDDDLTFAAENLVAGELAVLFASASRTASPLPLGGGLRCVGSSVMRLETRVADASGEADFGPGHRAQGGWSAGDVRSFQVWYRDPAPGSCNSGVNTSSGIEARFFP